MLFDKFGLNWPSGSENKKKLWQRPKRRQQQFWSENLTEAFS